MVRALVRVTECLVTLGFWTLVFQITARLTSAVHRAWNHGILTGIPSGDFILRETAHHIGFQLKEIAVRDMSLNFQQ
jgi:hypothetical protein